jgi:hypothetical protein
MSIDKYIYVTFAKEGVHCYPEALVNPELEDVKFLGYPHRHMFHFYVKIDVKHSNRDIEFIQFKRWLESLYDGGVIELNNKSCEMIAEDVIMEIKDKYDLRYIEVDVSEDKENGATLVYKK